MLMLGSSRNEKHVKLDNASLAVNAMDFVQTLRIMFN